MTSNHVVLVAHKFLTQPDDDFILYLNGRKLPSVLHIMHSFSDAPDRCSSYRWYRNGELVRSKTTRDYRDWPEFLIYFKEMFYTLLWIGSSRVRWDTYIGMDGLCVLWGNWLRKWGRARKTVFWQIDFVPKNRFREEWKNRIYQWININGYKIADEMWDLSARMRDAREQKLGFGREDYKLHKVVPYGMWLHRIKHYSYEECEQNTMVFMGHLIEKQGVQLVLDAIPKIVSMRPDFMFKIIGTGAYRDSLVARAKALRVEPHCHFLGKIQDITKLEDEVARSCVAIAPYIKSLDTWTGYTDPGKVKTYLGCGVPLLVTGVPWNAREIEKEKCGLIIEESSDNIAEKVLYLMNRNINEPYRENAISYSRTFDYSTIFQNLLP